MSSTVNSAAFVRRRRIIIESDSSSDENNNIVMPSSQTVREIGAVVPNDVRLLLDSSDDSLEHHLQSLRITDQDLKDDEEEIPGERDDEQAQMISSSCEAQVNTPEQSEVDENSSDEGLGEDSAWSLDRQTNEYFLSFKKISHVRWPKLRVPASLFRQLFWHQKVGVQWMATLHENGIGGILGDDMGMGKTFMTLTYLGGLMRAKTIKNALIIAPLSVLRSWEKEAGKVSAACVPNVRIQVLSSDIGRNRRQEMLRRALEWYVCSVEPRVSVLDTM